MTLCAVEFPACPALATDGPYCPIHAKGLRFYQNDDGRHCGGCSKRLKTGKWVTIDDNGLFHHYPSCSAKKKK